MSSTASQPDETWPSLPLDAWSETCATLHLWTQIVGKIRMVQTPSINHSWHVTLYVTARALRPVPFPTAPGSLRLTSILSITSLRSVPATAAWQDFRYIRNLSRRSTAQFNSSLRSWTFK